MARHHTNPDPSTLSEEERRARELEAQNQQAPPPPSPPQQPGGEPSPQPTPLAAAEAEVQKKADEGKPDPLAQSKITGAAGAQGDLAIELAKLPPIPALDGLRANAAYYRTAPKEELVRVLKGLPYEDEGGRTQRDWLVQRAESGEFSRG